MDTGFTLAAGSTPGPKSHRALGLKRSIALAGHKTSVSLEDQFWVGTRLQRAKVLRHLRSSSGSTPSAPFTIFRRPSGCSYWIISEL